MIVRSCCALVFFTYQLHQVLVSHLQQMHGRREGARPCSPGAHGLVAKPRRTSGHVFFVLGVLPIQALRTYYPRDLV